jgi:hypothetical protein
MKADPKMTAGRRAIAVFVMVFLCGVGMLVLGCDDPCSRGGVGCPCTEHDDCAGWCTSDGCELGTEQGDWTPCLYEEPRTCDEVCGDTGQSCSTACDWPLVAAAYSETDAACTVEGQPDWLSPWTVVSELDETPACEALIAAPYRSCCCLPAAT